MHFAQVELIASPATLVFTMERFLAVYAEKYRRSVSGISEEAAQLLKAHAWSGNLTLVAKELGISRPTLYSKLRKYNI